MFRDLCLYLVYNIVPLVTIILLEEFPRLNEDNDDDSAADVQMFLQSVGPILVFCRLTAQVTRASYFPELSINPFGTICLTTAIFFLVDSPVLLAFFTSLVARVV